MRLGLCALFPGALDAAAKQWLAHYHLPGRMHDAVLRIDAARNRHTVKRLADLLRRSQSPVVNFHYGGNFVLLRDVLAARYAGKRVVASVHHPYSWSETGQKKRLQTLITGPLLHRIVVPTVLMRSIMQQAGIPLSRLAVIPYGIGLPRSQPSREEARRRLNLPGHRHICGWRSGTAGARERGPFDPYLRRCILDASDLLLLVAGSGPARSDLEGQAQRDLGGAVPVFGQHSGDGRLLCGVRYLCCAVIYGGIRIG